ncbi:MAG: dynamin family protein [Caldilineaceae bacterium]|nr:dynamin family protein [Caldilineaceae bacterium]
MQRILTAEQDRLIRRERSLLEDLRVLLVRLGAPDDDLALLKRSLHQLDELFLLVVVGEFNAGKTAFLNAMLGERLLTEGVLPTTSQIQLLRYGERQAEDVTGDDILVVHLPVEWLREVNLVDTPGTNAIIQRHQEITEHFIPRSDLVLFVTSADRPSARASGCCSPASASGAKDRHGRQQDRPYRPARRPRADTRLRPRQRPPVAGRRTGGLSGERPPGAASKDEGAPAGAARWAPIRSGSKVSLSRWNATFCMHWMQPSGCGSSWRTPSASSTIWASITAASSPIGARC